MNVWIITTGSSDVQLTTNDHWNPLCDLSKEQKDIKKKLNFSKGIELTKSVVKPKGSNDPITRFLAPARAMGIVYGNAIAEKAEYYNDLDFPLLNNFSTLLNEKKIIFDKIIVFVTDQTDLFTTPAEKKQIYCPYWQDTCTFEEIIKEYFQRFPHKVEKIQPEFLILKPDVKNPDSASNRKPGLDDWNSVLKLVQKKFAGLTDISEDATIYVSHQASTPAISSAIQFASLAKFGKQVEFLVSNVDDREHPADVIRSGEYLKGIKFQEAKALLDRHDYAGVKDLIAPYLTPEIQILLDAAIQWNFAKFDKFEEKLLFNPDGNPGLLSNSLTPELLHIVTEVKERTKKQNWWWTAYEAAWLGVVRLDQGNTVEALFHSFRSVEGLISEWARETYPDDVKYERDQYNKWVWFVKKTIHNKLPNYRVDKFPRGVESKIKLFSQSLYDLLKEAMPEIVDHADMNVFLNDARDKRNELFHQLLGLQKVQVYEAWSINIPEKTKEEEDWKKINHSWQIRVLGCINFVSSQKQFNSLEEASLMFHVHEELKKAIAPNNLQT